MWVAETVEYPNGRRGMRDDLGGAEWLDHGGLDLKPGVQNREAHDRISILTDSKGDGVMDKKEVFFEGLELVTGFVFHRDGVIAAAAPDIFFLRDTDGDGKADKVEKLYTGLGTADTHAVINNLRWGADGWIYATHGYSGSDHVKSGDGKRDFGRIGSGVVRFKPDGSAFEQYSSKGGNTWGLAITTEQRHVLDAADERRPAHADAAAGVGARARAHRRDAELPGHQEKPALLPDDDVGAAGVSADRFGRLLHRRGGLRDLRRRHVAGALERQLFLHRADDQHRASRGARPRGRELHVPQGSRTARRRNSSAPATCGFGPIEVRVGPDGALYVLDFYNQAVIHNDTRGPVHNNVNAAVRPDRDHYFGRIWRVDHRDAAKVKPPDLSKATEAGPRRGVEERRTARFASPRNGC